MFQRILQAYRTAFSGLPRDVWLLCVAALINRMGTMVLPFLGLYLTLERGLDTTTVGAVLGVYGAGSIAGSWLGGWSSDRIGPSRTQQLSLATSGVGFLIIPMLTGLGEIVVAVFLASVMAEAFRPAVMSDLGGRAPTISRARAYALLRLAVNLGMGIGPALGGFLALHSYRWLFVGDAVTCWLAAGLMVWWLPDPRPANETRADAPAARPRPPWRDGPFLGLMVLVFLLATVFFQVFSTMPIYLRQVHGFRENTIGLLLAFNAALIVIFEMLLIAWAERRDRFFLTGLGCFLVAVGFGLMPLGASALFIALTIAVWTLGEMLSLPLMNALVADRADPASRGRYMGLYTMAFSVAFVFAPISGTFVYDRFGPDVLWYGLGALGPPMWLGAIALRRHFIAGDRPLTRDRGESAG